MGNTATKLSTPLAPRSKAQKFTSTIIAAAIATTGAYFTFLHLKQRVSCYLERISAEKQQREQASRLLSQVQRNTVVACAEQMESFCFPFLQGEFNVEEVQSSLKLCCYASSEDLLIGPTPSSINIEQPSDRKAAKIKHWEAIKSFGFQRSFALVYVMPLICLASAVQHSLALRESTRDAAPQCSEGIVRAIREISAVVFEHFAKISLTTTFAALQDLQQEFGACHSKCTSLLIELLQERQLIFGKHSPCESDTESQRAFVLHQKIADEFYDYVESKAFAHLLLLMCQNRYESFLKLVCRDISFPVQLPKIVAAVAKWMPKVKANATEVFFDLASLPLVEQYCAFVLGNY